MTHSKTHSIISVLLSTITIDTDKDWQGYNIINLGTNGYNVHDTLESLLAGQFSGNLSDLAIDADKDWQGQNITNFGAGSHDINSQLNNINQDVKNSASPTFAGLTVVNPINEFSTDGTLAGDSDSALPTEQAVKTYVDNGVNEITTISENIDFSASSEEDITIAIGGNVREILRGRLYIDTDPGSAFSAWVTYTFYNKAAMKGEDAFYRATAKLVYTELDTATTGSDANIIPDDHTDFSPNDLVYFLDGGSSEFARLQTIASTMIAEDNVVAHAIDTGLVRVSEFSGFSLFNNESGTDVYLRVNFESSQTVSLKMELLVRK